MNKLNFKELNQLRTYFSPHNYTVTLSLTCCRSAVFMFISVMIYFKAVVFVCIHSIEFVTTTIQLIQV